MKMNFGFFLGALLILMGVLLIIKIFVPLNIPVFKIAFGLFVIYIGVRILTSGSSCSHKKNDTTCQILFDEVNLGDKELGRNLAVVFGKATYDLRHLSLSGHSRHLEINVAFGEAHVLLPSHIPVIIHGNVAFGLVVLPQGNTASFGTSQYMSPSFNNAEPHLDIKLDIAFGKGKVSLSE